MSTDGLQPAGPAIEARGLTRCFGKLVAVDHMDLIVTTGRVFGLLGPNGAGKSTAIKMLTTLLPPTSGAARVAGFDVVREAVRVREHIGYVPQLVSADGALTGRENLAFSAKLYGLPRAERRRRIDEALARMGLTGVTDTLVRTYSGGMVRRLEVAQDALRTLMLDGSTSAFGLGVDLAVQGGAFAVLVAVAARLYPTLVR